MEFKGTKGEWFRDSDNKIYSEEFNSFITEVFGGSDVTIQEDEANAKLIAAAPELLEALQGLMKEYKNISEDSGDPGWWSAEDQADYIRGMKAIEKALK